MAKELRPGVYSELPPREKRRFLDLRKAIEDMQTTIDECVGLIAEDDSLRSELEPTIGAAQAKKERLSRAMRALVVRLNFEWGPGPGLPGFETDDDGGSRGE